MTHLNGKPRATYIKEMFTRIARSYDRANHWMTFRQDRKWRREVIRLVGLKVGGALLDVGTGTGDLARAALDVDTCGLCVGMDFTPEMMHQGRLRRPAQPVRWLTADALDIPFPHGSFSAVVSAYLLRNVTDLDRALSEQYRVLEEGGRMVCLETTPLPKGMMHLAARAYVRYLIPLIGRLAGGEKTAYGYLPESTRNFIPAEELAEHMRKVGFASVQFKRLMGSTLAIHWGVK